MGVGSFQDLRAWQTARAFKLAVYRLTDGGSLAGEPRLREQLREAAASAPSQIAEGFGRFEPLDNARYVRGARASLLECQNHLIDAVDRGRLEEPARKALEPLIEAALVEVGGWLDYLQSPEARRNAERVKQNRIRRRQRRHANPEPEP
jgi:four helix bundle protein